MATVTLEDDRLLSLANNACHAGNLGHMHVLLGQWRPLPVNASFSSRNAREQSLLFNVMVKRHLCLIEPLLEKGSEITPLIVQVAHVIGTIEVFEVLMRHCWDINSNPVEASLRLAVEFDNIPLVEWHLEHGADPNIHGGYRNEPLSYAAESSDIAIVRLLVNYGAKLNNSFALIAATAGEDESRLEVMSFLLDVGVDVNTLEEEGDRFSDNYVFKGTALHRAVQRADLDRVLLLLERGANPNIRGSLGWTPLEAAKLENRRQIAALLEEYI